MKNTQQHPIINLELKRTMLAVVMAASIFLGLKKASTNLLQKLITIPEQGVHCFGCSNTQPKAAIPATHAVGPQ